MIFEFYLDADRMKILYRYVFTEMIAPFILGLVAFSFVIIPRLAR